MINNNSTDTKTILAIGINPDRLGSSSMSDLLMLQSADLIGYIPLTKAADNEANPLLETLKALLPGIPDEQLYELPELSKIDISLPLYERKHVTPAVQQFAEAAKQASYPMVVIPTTAFLTPGDPSTEAFRSLQCIVEMLQLTKGINCRVEASPAGTAVLDADAIKGISEYTYLVSRLGRYGFELVCDEHGLKVYREASADLQCALKLNGFKGGVLGASHDGSISVPLHSPMTGTELIELLREEAENNDISPAHAALLLETIDPDHTDSRIPEDADKRAVFICLLGTVLTITSSLLYGLAASLEEDLEAYRRKMHGSK